MRLIVVALLVGGCIDERRAIVEDEDAAVLADTALPPDAESAADAELPAQDGAPSAPCLQVAPTPLVIEARVGASTTRELTIENCGASAVVLEAARLSRDTAPTFTLTDEAGLASAPVELPAAGPARSYQLPVQFLATEEAAYEGELIVDVFEQPELRVPLVGRGTLNVCPEAIVAESFLEVRPLDIVTLDGSLSRDEDGPDGRPVHWEWIVVQRPDGSTAQPVERYFNPPRPVDGGPADDGRTPTAQFFVDLAGAYVIELRVTDADGAIAPSDGCPQAPARIEIRAVPDEAIWVQLVWHNPADPDETDGEGSDLDLHLLHPLAEGWADVPYNCHYANPAPDWGPPGPAGDPTHDLDDSNGAGPENIHVFEPEDTSLLGERYRVGVHYRRAEDFLGGGTWGPAEATVRVFLAGQLVGEWRRILEATDAFWEVAGIVWTPQDKRVVEIDQLHPVFP